MSKVIRFGDRGGVFHPVVSQSVSRTVVSRTVVSRTELACLEVDRACGTAEQRRTGNAAQPLHATTGSPSVSYKSNYKIIYGQWIVSG